MEILLALLLIGGGAAFAVVQYRRSGARMMETQFMPTTSVKDALDLVKEMSSTDPFYRHYVELKGTLVCKEPLTTPYANRSAAYYSSRCLSVSEVTSVYSDDEGNRHTRVTKQETEISSEHHTAEAYLSDGSSETPVYVNFESFGGDMDLAECCDRFESAGSPWASQFGTRYSYRMASGSRFLGYRLMEKMFPAGGPVYVLGELLNMGDRYVIEKAQMGKKPSLLSYKSEEQIVQDHKNSQMSAVILGGVMVLAGIALLVMRFT